MEDSFPIESFKYGIDTRRSVLTSQVGTLVTCENGFINQGGEIEKRKKFDDPGYGTDTFDDQHRSIAITSVGTLATATLSNHGLTTGEYVKISGANESGYNGTIAVTVLTSNTFTYVMDADPDSPATGSPVLDYVGTYGLEATDEGLVVFGSARDFDEDYVTTNGVASVAIKGSGTGATFNITAVSGAITVVAVNAGGSGYAVGDILTLTTSTGVGAILTVATLAVTAVASVTITNNGNEQLEPFLATGLTTVVYQQLRHPTLVNDTTEDYVALYHRMTAVVFSENFNGKAFVCAQFSDGRRYLYYDGTLIQHSVNGVVLENRLSISDLAIDAVRQAEAMEWSGYANRREVILDSLTRAGTTATGTYTAHGLTTGDFINVRGTTTNAGANTVTSYNGRFPVTVTGADTFTYTMATDPGFSADAGTPIATIYQSGSALIDSPAADYFSIVPSETADAGQVGFQKNADNIPGIAGIGSQACFEVTTNTGTFQLLAPENSDGTGSVDLCGGAVAVASSAATTATKIVTAVNDLSFIHGYRATISGAKVFIHANPAWGPVTFNLTLEYTGGADASSCSGTSGLTVTVFEGGATTSFDINVATRTPIFSSGTARLIAEPRGGTPPYTYSWEQRYPGSGGFITIISPTVQVTATRFDLPFPGTPFPQNLGSNFGYFKVVVTDSLGNIATAEATYNFLLF